MMIGESTENLLRGYPKRYNDVGAYFGSGTTTEILERYLTDGSGNSGGRPIGSRIPQNFANDSDDNVDDIGKQHSVRHSRRDSNLKMSLDALGDTIAQRLRDIDIGISINKNRDRDDTDIVANGWHKQNPDEHSPEDVKIFQDQYEVILSDLYSRLREYLQRNKLSLTFLELLKNYIDNLVDFGTDPFKNKYLLEIQNELLSTPVSLDDGRSSKIDDIMYKFLMYPEDITMKLTLIEYNKRQAALKRYFLRWRLSYDLRIVTDELYQLFVKFQKEKYFQLWRQKFEKVNERAQLVARRADGYRLMYFGFDRWLFKYDMIHRENDRADKQFQISKLTRIVKRWKKLRDVELKVSAILRDMCLKSALKIWVLNSRRNKLKQLGLPRKYLEKLKTRMEMHNIMEARAATFRELSLKHKVLKSFYLRYREDTARQQQLDRLEEQFLKGKGFQIYLRTFRLREFEHRATKTLDNILLGFVLRKLWVRQFRSNIRCSTLYSRQDDRLKRRYFNHLKKSLFFNVRPSQFERLRLLKMTIKAWRRHKQLSSLLAVRRFRIIRKFQTEWERRQFLSERYRFYQVNVIQRIVFQKWVIKDSIETKNELLADHAYSLKLKKVFLLKLISHMFNILKMDAKCLLFQKIKAMKMFQQGYRHTKLVQSRCNLVSTKSVEEPILQRFLNRWKIQTRLKRKFKLKNRFNVCREQRNIRLKRRVLILMTKRYRLYSIDLSRKANLMADKNLEKLCFRRLRNKLQAHIEKTRLSDQLYEDSILHSALTNWVGKLNDIQRLDDTYNVSIIQRNLRMLSGILGTWSMKLLRISRNQESVQVFRQRWDRAVLRGLLLLWRVKWQGLNSGREKSSTSSAATTTTLTKDKDNNDNNYPLNFTTPARSLVSDDSTIPGSVSMRRTKMEAVINRYRRVGRAIPSPIKSSDAFTGPGGPAEGITSTQTAHWQPYPRPRPPVPQTRLTWSIPPLRHHLSNDSPTLTPMMTPSVSTLRRTTQPRVHSTRTRGNENSSNLNKRIDFENILELKPDVPIILPPVQISRGTTRTYDTTTRVRNGSPPPMHRRR